MRLESYDTFASVDLLAEQMVASMLAGLSGRRYQRALEPVGEQVAASGVGDVAELGQPPLHHRHRGAAGRVPLPAARRRALADRVRRRVRFRRPHDGRRARRDRGRDEGAARGGRGLDRERRGRARPDHEPARPWPRRLARASCSCSTAARRSRRRSGRCSASQAVIARCRLHKERNVLDHLPEAERLWVRRKLRAAWANPDAAEAEAALAALAGQLDKVNPDSPPRPSSAASRATGSSPSSPSHSPDLLAPRRRPRSPSAHDRMINQEAAAKFHGQRVILCRTPSTHFQLRLSCAQSFAECCHRDAALSVRAYCRSAPAATPGRARRTAASSPTSKG